MVIASQHGPRCVAAEAVALEIAEHLPRLAAKRLLDSALLFAAPQVMPIEWKPQATYQEHRAEAERRIALRDPDDRPTVALALTLELPVGSQDKELSDAGLTVFTTGDLLDALRADGHTDSRCSGCVRTSGDRCARSAATKSSTVLSPNSRPRAAASSPQ